MKNRLGRCIESNAGIGRSGRFITKFQPAEIECPHSKLAAVYQFPDLAVTGDVTTSFLDFIPKETTLAMRDFLWLRERIQVVHDEALTPQAIAVQEAEAKEKT